MSPDWYLTQIHDYASCSDVRCQHANRISVAMSRDLFYFTPPVFRLDSDHHELALSSTPLVRPLYSPYGRRLERAEKQCYRHSYRALSSSRGTEIPWVTVICDWHPQIIAMTSLRAYNIYMSRTYALHELRVWHWHAARMPDTSWVYKIAC